MGVYLSDPKTDKESEDVANKKFTVGVSGMQGTAFEIRLTFRPLCSQFLRLESRHGRCPHRTS